VRIDHGANSVAFGWSVIDLVAPPLGAPLVHLSSHPHPCFPIRALRVVVLTSIVVTSLSVFVDFLRSLFIALSIGPFRVLSPFCFLDPAETTEENSKTKPTRHNQDNGPNLQNRNSSSDTNDDYNRNNWSKTNTVKT
jgi:hypothetical protein